MNRYPWEVRNVWKRVPVIVPVSIGKKNKKPWSKTIGSCTNIEYSLVLEDWSYESLNSSTKCSLKYHWNNLRSRHNVSCSVSKQKVAGGQFALSQFTIIETWEKEWQTKIRLYEGVAGLNNFNPQLPLTKYVSSTSSRSAFDFWLPAESVRCALARRRHAMHNEGNL